MRMVFVTCLVFFICSCLLYEAASASDDAPLTTASANVDDQQQEDACPPAELVCSLYTGGACEVGAHFTGREALEKNYLAEAEVKPKDDNTLFPTTWEVKHRGQLLVFGQFQCELALKNNQKTILEIPPAAHCAAQLMTAEHHYIWFFASNPESGCVGYGECVCY